MDSSYEICIEDYLTDNSKSYCFFDGLIKQSKNTQKDIFKELEIKQSTYRAYRQNGKDNENVNIISKLSGYFNCNNIDMIEVDKVEVLLNDVLKCVFYKSRNIVSELIEEIDYYIGCNTILNPILVLFKVLLILFNSKCYDDLFDELKDELFILSSYIKTDYFTNELNFIYKSILYFYNKIEDEKYLEENSKKYTHISWIYFNLRAMKAYYEDDNSKAISYYSRALKIYEEYYSLERVMMVINIIACEYNNMGEYYLAIDECDKIINYVYSISNHKYADNLSLHYVYAKYKLEKYEEIIQFYYKYIKKLNSCNKITQTIIMLSAYKLKRIDIIDELLKSYNNEYLLAFHKYIIDNDDSLISKLKHSSYSQKLYLELKSTINSKK